MYPELMFVQDVKVLYNSILSDEKSQVNLKIQVLKNLQTYLQEEDSRMQEADRECEPKKATSCDMQRADHVEPHQIDDADFLLNSGKKKAKQEDLKEMGDISSGMSSSIMQIYLKQVLESFFHTQSTVRHFALSVITLTLSQGLIHPVQVCSRSRSSIFSNKNSSSLAFLFCSVVRVEKKKQARSETFHFSVCALLDCHGNRP